MYKTYNVAVNVVHSVRISIGGRFLENCFYYYSQQIIHAIANESLTSCNPVKREA